MKPVIESGQAAQDKPLTVNTENLKDILSLAQTRQGQQCKIVGISGGVEVQTRLASLGILPGQDIEIIQAGGKGPVLALVKGAKVALGHGVSHKILVRPNMANSSKQPE
jgi:Fe2+ transport system protein FeoA